MAVNPAQVRLGPPGTPALLTRDHSSPPPRLPTKCWAGSRPGLLTRASMGRPPPSLPPPQL